MQLNDMGWLRSLALFIYILSSLVNLGLLLECHSYAYYLELARCVMTVWDPTGFYLIGFEKYVSFNKWLCYLSTIIWSFKLFIDNRYRFLSSSG